MESLNSIGSITVERLEKSFGDVAVLKGIDLCVKPGEFVSLIGRSGCGKSTLLNCLAGLEQFSGSVTIEGSRPGFVFQSYALFPWKTVAGNVRFALRGSDLDRIEKDARVNEVLELVQLQGTANQYPAKLSGGMQQRVAIARSLAPHPSVLLMDEPFGALDSITRAELQHRLLDIWSSRCLSVVFVTHSVHEAAIMSDRIVTMKSGRIADVAHIRSPRPRSLSSPEVAAVVERVERLLGVC